MRTELQTISLMLVGIHLVGGEEGRRLGLSILDGDWTKGMLKEAVMSRVTWRWQIGHGLGKG